MHNLAKLINAVDADIRKAGGVNHTAAKARGRRSQSQKLCLLGREEGGGGGTKYAEWAEREMSRWYRNFRLHVERNLC